MSKPVAFLLSCSVVAITLAAAPIVRAEEPRASLDYFEREVRPILVDACHKCHGPNKQESDLRLDSREAALKGGVSGAAIVPGQPEKSLLIAAIRHVGDIKMPPQAKLTEAQIAAVAHWVKLGAPWPNKEEAHLSKLSSVPLTHWAFQPVRDPSVPIMDGNNSPNPIDAFIRAKLVEAKLARS